MSRLYPFVIPLLLGLCAVGVGRYIGGHLDPGPTFMVEASPVPACVFVDDVFCGTADKELTIRGFPAGIHSLRVTAQGYTAVRRQVEFGALAGKVSIALEKIQRAELKVTSRPSGGVVVLDGHVRGRTPLSLNNLSPGAHAFEVRMTNYLDQHRSLVLEPGKMQSVNVELKHREVTAYRRRIAADPGDIGAYNDLGELLFVLERHEEAARVFVEGFIITDKYASRDEPNRRNAGKLAREARNKHRDPEGIFRKSLDKEIMRAIAAGKMSKTLFKEFKQVDYNRQPEAYLAAYLKLVDTYRQTNLYLLDYLEFTVDRRRFDLTVSAARKWLGRKPSHIGEFVRAFGIMRKAYTRAPVKERESLLAAINQIRKAVQPRMKAGAMVAEIIYEEALMAKAMGKVDVAIAAMEKAIAAQKSKTSANAWRLQLAQYLLREKKDKQKTADILALIMDKANSKDKSTREAARILKSLKKQGVVPKKKEPEKESKKEGSKEKPAPKPK